MAESTNEAPTKKPRAPSAIVATITMHAIGKATDDAYLDRALEMKRRQAAAVDVLMADKPDWLEVSIAQPKPGKTPTP